MAKVVVKSKVKKVKRKFPIEYKAPSVFSSTSLGNAEVTDLKALVGRTIKMNLMYITNSMKNQNVRMTFKVIDVDSGIANTELVKYEQIAYYLNRFVRVGSDLVEDSFVVPTKDGKKLRIKPFCITKSQASKLVLTAIREKIKELIAKEASEKTSEEFIHAVSMGKVQTGFRNEVKKIFPLKAFEFKKVVLEE